MLLLFDVFVIVIVIWCYCYLFLSKVIIAPNSSFVSISFFNPVESTDSVFMHLAFWIISSFNRNDNIAGYEVSIKYLIFLNL